MQRLLLDKWALDMRDDSVPRLGEHLSQEREISQGLAKETMQLLVFVRSHRDTYPREDPEAEIRQARLESAGDISSVTVAPCESLSLSQRASIYLPNARDQRPCRH